MNLDVTPLFQPLKIRNKKLPNRIVMPAMRTNMGIITPQGIEWYRQRARGGVGLVIVEATPVPDFKSGRLTLKHLKPLADIIHDGGALAVIQLIPLSFQRHVLQPGEIERQEIEEILQNFQKATEICLEAGFEGVEPHGAHGYLFNQFFSPVKNRRTDEFGGTMANRMRLALNVVTKLRPILGDDGLLFYRHTPVGEGYGLTESVSFAEALVQSGVDVLDLSPSSIEYPGDRSFPFKELGVPVIAVNELNQVQRALEVLNHKRADLVAVGRGLIADPDWPRKIREGRFQDILECIGCNQGCFGNLEKDLLVQCTQWEA